MGKVDWGAKVSRVQLKVKWDDETKGRLGEREDRKDLRRPTERERASGACWTLTVCEASIIHAAVHMSRAHRQAQQQGRAQIKQRNHGQCPQCTWRNTPQLISLLFLDKQRTRLPERCLILLQSHELLGSSLLVFSHFIYQLGFFWFVWQWCLCRWVPYFHGSLLRCFIHFNIYHALSVFYVHSPSLLVPNMSAVTARGLSSPELEVTDGSTLPFSFCLSISTTALLSTLFLLSSFGPNLLSVMQTFFRFHCFIVQGSKNLQHCILQLIIQLISSPTYQHGDKVASTLKSKNQDKFMCSQGKDV